MRYILYFIFTLILLFPAELFASHGVGGEISWESHSNGQYKFRLVFYRDCNGIAAPFSIPLATTVPGISFITLNKVQQEDISYTGFNPDGITPCASCSTGSTIPALVEKNVYESALVTLTGVPPAAGWQFYWGECCRNAVLTNISGAGAIGFRYLATMFPFQGQNVSTYDDSSPYFVDDPLLGMCSGLPQEFSYLTHDNDEDSVVYSWASLLDDNGVPIPFAPGYSINSQLPSNAQNPLNVPVVLNTKTGEVTYTGFTGGVFLVKVMATSYRCGIKISEIIRETTLIIHTNCGLLFGGDQNLPPNFNAPFQNPVTGLNTDYADTVLAGDTVDFMITIQDFQFFMNSMAQTISVGASGELFGTNFTDPNNGCQQPPCAIISPGMPLSFQVAGQYNFHWVTTIDHAITAANSQCGKSGKLHLFTLTFCDNFCPANACITKTISILVVPRLPLAAPVLRCAAVTANGSVALSWSPTTSIDSLNLFMCYKIYASNSLSGPFLLVDSVSSGINATSYLHSASSITSLFGSNANHQQIFYKVTTTIGYNSLEESSASNIVSSIKLSVIETPNHSAFLNWNAPSIPPLNSYASKYKIYKEYPSGTWVLIDSTALTNFTDNSVQSLCNDSVSYRIELSDATGCILASDVNGKTFNTPTTVAVITPQNPVACGSQLITLTASNGQSYLWSTGQTTQSIQVGIAGSYTVTVTQTSGCSGSASTNVNFNPLPNPIITGNTTICQGSFTQLNAGPSYTMYLWNTGAATQIITVSAQGTYTVTVADANGCTGTTSVMVTVNPLPAVNAVANGNTSFCQGDSLLLSSTPGFQTYLWYRYSNPIVPTVTQAAFYVKSRGVYKCSVTDLNGCSNYSNSISVYVPCIQLGPDIERGNVSTSTDDLVIKVNPNPSNGDFYVTVDGASDTINDFFIFDETGRRVDCEITNETNSEFRISGLQTGIYFLQIGSGNSIQHSKLIKLKE